MQIFTKLSTRQGPKPGREGGTNLWRQWVHNPKAICWLLRDEDVFRSDDLGVVENWAQKQAEWGLHVRLHAGATGMSQVAEVFGPDLVQPHVLAYRVGEEVQVDEAHGASRSFTDMAEALDFVTKYT